jgi:hypothetical protein
MMEALLVELLEEVIVLQRGDCTSLIYMVYVGVVYSSRTTTRDLRIRARYPANQGSSKGDMPYLCINQ